jgi:adenine deaminase
MTYILQSLTAEKMSKLISISRFKSPATAWIRGAKVLQIYTGEINQLHVVLSEDRIAYVGEKEPLIDSFTEIIDAQDFTLVPGYIEPHAHSFQVYNPQTLCEFALAHGTTVLLHDNLPFFLQLQQQELEGLIEAFQDMPIKNFWWARLDPQVSESELDQQFTSERVRSMVRNPAVLQAGELTYWKDLIDGDPSMIARMWEARQTGKRIETHNPGASIETLNAVAAAGATGINAEEVMRRIRLGYYATLRHSSIRPDLSELVKGLLADNCRFWDRMMLTTDGSPPFFLGSGFMDECIRIAIKAGLDPVTAYRMASLNPAVYYGLDQDLGGISPGRIADIVFLEDIRNPAPVKVMANGSIVAENQKLTTASPELEWSRFGIGGIATMNPIVQPEWFDVCAPEEKVPVIELVNAVITRCRLEQLPILDGKVQLSDSPGYLYVALLHREGDWITTGVIKGFGDFDALVSTYSLSGDLVILGRDPVEMAKASNHILTNKGGICMFQNGKKCYDLPLPLLGTMSLLDMDTLIEKTTQFFDLMHQSGYLFSDPIYSLLFVSATHLPKIRLSSQGVLNVNDGEILLPSRRLLKSKDCPFSPMINR